MNGSQDIFENLFTREKLYFAATCAFLGLIVVILDWVIYSLQGKSLLKLKWRWPGGLGLCLLWGVGAGLGGYIGAILSVVQLNIQSSMSVGVGWPALLPRFLQSFETEEPVQEVNP